MNIEIWKYCPRCSGPLDQTLVAQVLVGVKCAICGFYKYDNPLPTTIGLIVNERGELLLLRRSQAPQVGKWDAVGGFLSGSETAEACLRREAKEEIGCELGELQMVGTFSSVYGDTGLRTIGIAFSALLDSSEALKLSEENSEHLWVDPKLASDIAFEDVRSAVATLAAQGRDAHPS